jgi:hypothetical protein
VKCRRSGLSRPRGSKKEQTRAPWLSPGVPGPAIAENPSADNPTTLIRADAIRHVCITIGARVSVAELAGLVAFGAALLLARSQ